MRILRLQVSRDRENPLDFRRRKIEQADQMSHGMAGGRMKEWESEERA
jgi:hypothetical protein